MKRLPISTWWDISDVIIWHCFISFCLIHSIPAFYSDTFIWPHNSYIVVASDKNKLKCSFVCIDCSLDRISIRSKQLSLWGDFFILRLQCRGQRTLLLNWTLLKQQKYKKTPLFYICFYTYWITKERQKCMYCVLKNKTTKDKSNTKSWENASGTKVCYNARGRP